MGVRNPEHLPVEGLVRRAVPSLGQQVEQRVGQVQRRRVQGRQHGVQAPALVGGGHDAGGLPRVTLHGIGEVDPPHQLGRRIDLVAMEQIDRHQHPAQVRDRRPVRQVAHAEMLQGDAADLHHMGKARHRIGAVVPQGPGGVGRAGGTGVVVADIALPVGIAVGDDGIQLAAALRPVRHGGVEPLDGKPVPAADADLVGVRQAQRSVTDRHSRRRIVHHRGPVVIGGRGEVVGQTDGMAGLVHRQLADAGQAHLHRIIGSALAGLVGAHQALEDHAVLADAERAQQDRALQDLARAGVRDRPAIGPAPGLAMDPVDHVVAHVHGVRPLGQHLHPEGVDEAGRIEGVGPPPRPLHQGGAHRFGCRAVHIEDDGLLHRRAGGRRVGLFQTEAAAQRLDRPVGQGRSVIGHQLADRAGPGVGEAGLETGRRQADQGLVRDHRDIARVLGDPTDLRPRLVAGKGQVGVELQIVGESPGLGHVGIAEIGHEVPVALVGLLQGRQEAEGVPDQEAGQVHHHLAVRRVRQDVGGPDDGRGERLADGPHLVRLVVTGAEPGILQLGHHLPARPAEHQDRGLGRTGPVHPHRGRAEAGPHGREGHIGPQRPVRLGVEGDQHPAALPVQIDRRKPVEALEILHHRRHRTGGGGRFRGRVRSRGKGRAGQQARRQNRRRRGPPGPRQIDSQVHHGHSPAHWRCKSRSES